MKIESYNRKYTPDKPLITLKNTEAGIYDILLMNPKDFSIYETLGVDIHIYPYARNVGSDDYVLAPFEDYVKNEKLSPYERIPNLFGLGFGMSSALGILLYVGSLNPDDLNGVESIVALLGSTYGGYNFGLLVDKVLKYISEDKRTQWKQQYFDYVLAKQSTRMDYNDMARMIRVGAQRLLPRYMSLDFGSNEAMLRMRYTRNQLNCEDSEVNIGALHFKEEHIDDIEKLRFQFGIHIKGGYESGIYTYREEFMQTIFQSGMGVIRDRKIVADTMEKRLTRTVLGKFKTYLHSELVDKNIIFKKDN